MWVLLLHNAEDRVCSKTASKVMNWVKENLYKGEFEFHLQEGVPSFYQVICKGQEIGIIVAIPEIK